MHNYNDFYQETTDEMSEYLTPREVMYHLGIGRNTFYRLVNSGELKAFRIGKLWRVKKDELALFSTRG